MTKPSEVTVSDAEVEQFRFDYMAEAIGNKAKPEEAARIALAAFLAARVPDAKPRLLIGELQDTLNEGHNALRAAVLRGPG